MKKHFLFLVQAIIVIALTFACGGGGDPAAVASVALNKTALTLKSSQQETLEAIIEPENAANKTVSWTSSNTNVAVVLADGAITALAPGRANIIVTTQDGGKMAFCDLTVTPNVVPVTGVTLNKNTLTLASSVQEALTADVAPADATNKSVIWTSSNTNVAMVSPEGIVTALSPGSATIIATTQDGGKTAFCNLTVTPSAVISVTGVTLDKPNLSLPVGGTETLNPTVLPEIATNKNVIWISSNQSVAVVSPDGLVLAISPGMAMIIVNTVDSGKTATCVLNVSSAAIPVTGVTLDKTSLNLAVGEDETLTPTVLPADATNKAVTWSSSNTAVATVSTNGVVTALGQGNAIIIVSTQEGGKTDICELEVTSSVIPVASVTLDETELILGIGYMRALRATVLPANATNKALAWTSSNPGVATVSPDGVVTAVSTGHAIIIVSSQEGGRTATCAIEVIKTEIPVTSVTLDKSSLTLGVGEEAVLTATVLPADATNKNIRWISSDITKATVTEDGLVKAVGKGRAVVIAVSKQDGSKLDYCEVTVE